MFSVSKGEILFPLNDIICGIGIIQLFLYLDARITGRGFMRPKKTDRNQQTINAFKQHKVLTFTAISSMLLLSIATVRRRLKEWGALSSYNRSGQYYTLPSIPEFNKQGLWRHEGAFFSKHGTLKNTVIHLVSCHASYVG